MLTPALNFHTVQKRQLPPPVHATMQVRGSHVCCCSTCPMSAAAAAIPAQAHHVGITLNGLCETSSTTDAALDTPPLHHKLVLSQPGPRLLGCCQQANHSIMMVTTLVSTMVTTQPPNRACTPAPWACRCASRSS
jgi:hypothetical protein